VSTFKIQILKNFSKKGYDFFGEALSYLCRLNKRGKFLNCCIEVSKVRQGLFNRRYLKAQLLFEGTFLYIWIYFFPKFELNNQKEQIMNNNGTKLKKNQFIIGTVFGRYPELFFEKTLKTYSHNIEHAACCRLVKGMGFEWVFHLFFA
jgi:hypothetical protein